MHRVEEEPGGHRGPARGLKRGRRGVRRGREVRQNGRGNLVRSKYAGVVGFRAFVG